MWSTEHKILDRKPEKDQSHCQFFFMTEESNIHYNGVIDIDPRELEEMKTLVRIVDVRQKEEFFDELGHIRGAKNIVLDTLPLSFHEIPEDIPVVFVCRSGNRSARAASFFQKKGNKNIYNLKGGMLLWNELGFSVE